MPPAPTCASMRYGPRRCLVASCMVPRMVCEPAKLNPFPRLAVSLGDGRTYETVPQEALHHPWRRARCCHWRVCALEVATGGEAGSHHDGQGLSDEHHGDRDGDGEDPAGDRGEDRA